MVSAKGFRLDHSSIGSESVAGDGDSNLLITETGGWLYLCEVARSSCSVVEVVGSSRVVVVDIGYLGM